MGLFIIIITSALSIAWGDARVKVIEFKVKNFT